MSFIDDIVDVGTSIFGGNGIGAMLARTAALGGVMYLMNRGSASSVGSAASASAAVDPKNRITLSPSPDNKIPVVYGTAYAPGILVDAQISNDNKTMHFVYVISEQTGVKLSDGFQSTFSFKDVYLNDQRITFKTDGFTVDYTTDKDGNIDQSARDLVKVYCYAGNSTWPVVPAGYTNNSLLPAYSVVANWTSNYLMGDLVFAVVEVNFNRDKNITQAPQSMKFHISNTMNQPGDCLYDYMTNTRYGAGIDAGAINA